AVSQNINTLKATGHKVFAKFTSSSAFVNDSTSATESFTINRVAITITANDQHAIYGINDTTLNAGYTLTRSLAQGDTITNVALSTSDSVGGGGNFNATPGASITPSNATGTGGFNATNYDITYLPGTLTVTPLGLSITGLKASKTYDGTTTGGITI